MKKIFSYFCSEGSDMRFIYWEISIFLKKKKIYKIYLSIDIYISMIYLKKAKKSKIVFKMRFLILIIIYFSSSSLWFFIFFSSFFLLFLKFFFTFLLVIVFGYFCFNFIQFLFDVHILLLSSKPFLFRFF